MTRSAGQLPNDVDTTHTHWRSDIIDPQTREAAEFDAGGVQQVRLLGPFRVTYDMALVNPGVKAFDLEAGQIVLMAWVEVVTAWDADPDNAMLSIVAGGIGHESGVATLVYDGLVGENETEPTTENYAQAAYHNKLVAGGGSGTYTIQYDGRPVRILTGPGAIRVTSTQVVGATQGEADIYALIAEPA